MTKVGREVLFYGTVVGIGVMDAVAIPLPWSVLVTFTAIVLMHGIRWHYWFQERRSLERRFAEQVRQRGGRMTILPPGPPPTSRGGASRPGHFPSSRPYLELPRVSGRPGAGMVTDERPVFLSPSLGATTAQAAENFRRNFTAALGIPLPVAVPRPFELFGKCPNCWTVDMHLLGDRDTTTDTTASGSSVCRECRACGHIWKERLDD